MSEKEKLEKKLEEKTNVLMNLKKIFLNLMSIKEEKEKAQEMSSFDQKLKQT